MLASAQIIEAVADSIKELGTIPSGHLYAALMGQMSIDDYHIILNALQQDGRVRVNNHLITWIGGD